MDLVCLSDSKPKTFLLRAAKLLMKLVRNKADWASQKYKISKPYHKRDANGFDLARRNSRNKRLFRRT